MLEASLGAPLTLACLFQSLPNFLWTLLDDDGDENYAGVPREAVPPRPEGAKPVVQELEVRCSNRLVAALLALQLNLTINNLCFPL